MALENGKIVSTSTDTVSYTHLDVYKRQILDRLRQVGALGDLPESSQVSFF